MTKSSFNKSSKNTGVLYIEYDKNDVRGQLIEKLKLKYPYKLSKHIIELIFLTEIVEENELTSCSNVVQDDLDEAFYKSSQLFFEKYEQANNKISTITALKIRQKRGTVMVEDILEPELI